MRRFIKSVFCFILCAFLLAGCSFDMVGINGAIDAVKPIKLIGETETRTFLPSNGFVGRKLDFENISFTNAKDGAKIYIVPSDETRVEATYPADLEDYGFRVYFKEGEIEISVPKQSNFIADKFEVTVYANIEEIDVSGSIELDVDASASKEMDIEVTGAASLYMHGLDARKVDFDIKGAAAIDVSGTADYLELELAGAGSIEAKTLICKKAEVKISGAGNASVSVIEELLADIDGVGALDYYGDPIIKNISGGLTDVEQVSKEVYGG